MNKRLVVKIVCLAVAGGMTMAYAADADRGKALFEDPSLGGGTTGKACVTCHPGGKGFGKNLFDRKEYTIMGMKKATLEEVINVCIEKPLGGKAIDPKGKDMEDLKAYMKTLSAR